MKDIDEILLNIDKDDDGSLFPEPAQDEKTNDDLAGIVDSADEIQGADSDPGEILREKNGVEDTAPDEPDDSDGSAGTGGAVVFALRGTKTWNRREPYLIAIDPDALALDVESQKKSFYFVETPADPETIRLTIKQEIVAFLRRPDVHITERYAGFIYGMIVTAIDELIASFEIPSDKRNLFAYHVGPLTIYRLIRERFNRDRCGYCYKYLPGNKAARYYPEEYIKFIILKWYGENVNSLDLPFDNIHDYEEMKQIVLRKYQTDLRIFNTRLEQLAARLGPGKRIGRNKLLAARGGEWFGHGIMDVYRRFLGASIFL